VYLSNFVPKLGPALMFIPREGGPKLIVSGAPNMLPAARRLTWIEEVEPLRDAGKTIVQWMDKSTGSGENVLRNRSALIGGNYMRAAFHASFMEAFSPADHPCDVTSTLHALMRCKSPRELAFIRESCAMLDAATKALTEAKGCGAGITVAVLEAEHAANHLGAQDVRTLFSVDGGRTFRPFEEPIDSAIDTLQAYIAVRHVGYWAEGFVSSPISEHPVSVTAAEALKAVIVRATAGTKCGDLARLAAENIRPYGAHAITTRNIGNGIGLSLEEEPKFSANSEETLRADEVYTLRVGTSDGRKNHSIVSAMVAVHQSGNELLWSAV
jgi:Xaa-Pro aminopeptidase